ncbi:hypothetical protein V6N11_063203 [Hibiscus sabdariffa]|uniref:Uncharacterized protein n=1 Tax=Hibiscus sabdariffa TaxID=183260 RepID=A0ABR2NWX4_9ROSI
MAIPVKRHHQKTQLDVLFLAADSVFRDTHRNSVKMDLKRSTSPPRICSVHRWMVVISRYVTRAAESYTLTVGIRHWSSRPPATTETESISTPSLLFYFLKFSLIWLVIWV